MSLSEKIKLCSDKMLYKFFHNYEIFDNIEEIINFVVYYLSEEARIAFFSADNSLKEVENLLIKKYIHKYRYAEGWYNNKLDEIIDIESEQDINKGCILFTDLVNSTTKINMMGDNNYYQNVLLKHNDIMKRAIIINDGRIIKNIGDAYLAIFSNHINALKACLQAQLEFEEINKERDTEDAISVRMALHYGDYYLKLVENNHIDVYGSSINYCARMINNVGGGQIFVSKDFINVWEKDNIVKIVNYNENWCYNFPTTYTKYDRENYNEIYSAKYSFCNEINFNTIGKYSFKGFDEDQELFLVNYTGNMNEIKRIDDTINQWIDSSLAQDRNRENYVNYHLKILPEIILKIIDNISDDKLSIIIEAIDTFNDYGLPIIIGLLNEERKEKVLRNLDKEDFNKKIEKIKERYTGTTKIYVNECQYIDHYSFFIKATGSLDNDTLKSVLLEYDINDRDNITQEIFDIDYEEYEKLEKIPLFKKEI